MEEIRTALPGNNEMKELFISPTEKISMEKYIEKFQKLKGACGYNLLKGYPGVRKIIYPGGVMTFISMNNKYGINYLKGRNFHRVLCEERHLLSEEMLVEIKTITRDN